MPVNTELKMSIPSHVELFCELRNNPELSDLVFVVGPTQKKFYGHKLLFSLVSPFFEKLFYTEDWKSKQGSFKQIELPQVDPKHFKIVYEFVYQQSADFTNIDSVKILGLSLKLKIIDLQTYCIKRIRKSLNLDNCMQVFQQINELGSKRLVTWAIGFIELRSFELLVQKGILNEIPIPTIVHILSSQRLCVPEIELVRRVYEKGVYLCEKEGLEIEASNIKEKVSELVPLIRLELSVTEHYDEIVKYDIFDQSTIVSALRLVIQVYTKQSSYQFPYKRARLKTSYEK
ncbi:btb/poz domain-containing [Anaeramoeba flamelloides]|uniref:Btb/poz domain-containing n=1 Tax=Anaeramoeba flamelloides TaxID=1746091 RepID=A0ABQ8XHA4_9EUKA|nr:btb/poz domain-containing [Anaeramoeba flamelloides]